MSDATRIVIATVVASLVIGGIIFANLVLA
jgi:hypothetical protein